MSVSECEMCSLDLVPRTNVEAWLKHLRNEFPAVSFKASTQSQKHHLVHSSIPPSLHPSLHPSLPPSLQSHKKGGLNTTPDAVMTSSACVGAELLLKLLGNYCRNAGLRTSITVGVVGE